MDTIELGTQNMVLDDTKGRLIELNGLADKFGTAMTRAFAGGIAHGKSLDDILKGLGQKFIDIGLPNADGLALLSFSKKHRPDAMHIIISSRRGMEDQRKAQEAGADAYLVKPVDTATLVRTVDAITARRAALDTPPSDWAA